MSCMQGVRMAECKHQWPSTARYIYTGHKNKIINMHARELCSASPAGTCTASLAKGAGQKNSL